MKQLTKKWLLVLLAVLSSICLALGLAACGGGGDEGEGDGDGSTSTQLSAPVISLDENTGIISWTAVDHATHYIVYEDGITLTNITKTEYQIDVMVPGTYEYTVAAYAEGYKTSDKSNAVTYTVSSNSGSNGGDSADNTGGNGGNQGGNSGNEGNGGNQGGNGNEGGSGNEGGNQPVDPTTNVLGVGSAGQLTVTIPAGESVHVDFDSTVVTSLKFKLEFNSTSYYFAGATFTVENDGTALGTYNKSTADEIIIEDIDFDKGLDVSHDSSEDIEIILTLTEVIEGIDYVLGVGQADMLDIVVQKNKFTISVAFSSDVVNGETYKLTANLTAGTGTESLSVQMTYGGESFGTIVRNENLVKNITVDKNKTIELTCDSAIQVNVISLKLEEILPDIPGISKDNPIIHNYIEGTHSTDTLKQAYFRLPNISDGDKYTIEFEAGVEIYLLGFLGGQTLLYSGEEVEDLTVYDNNYNYFYVDAPSNKACSFTLTKVDQSNVDNLPKLNLDQTLYYEDIGAYDIAATTYNVKDLEAGSYVLILSSSAGLTFYVRLGNGSASAMTSTGEYTGNKWYVYYTYQFTYSNQETLAIYINEKDGGFANTLTLIKANDAKSYDLSTTETSEGVAIGATEGNATKFNLVGVGAGEYLLAVTGDSGLNVILVVGANKYTLEYNNLKGAYTYELTISNQTSISIYSYEKFVADVSLTDLNDVDPDADLPKLGHGGANGATVVLSGDINYKASVTFKLVDVPAATYTVVLVFEEYTDYRNISVTAGSNTVQLCTVSGYQGDKSIYIAEGCDKLTLDADGIGSSQKITYTLYLLADGEEVGSGNGGNQGGDVGTGGDETELTVNVEAVNMGYAGGTAIDVSNLAFGEYTVTLTGAASGLDGYATYYISVQATFSDDDDYELNQANGFTTTINIATNLIYIYTYSGDAAGEPVTLNFEKILATSASFELNPVGWHGDNPSEVDVSGLAAGTYSISIYCDAFIFDPNTFYISFSADESDAVQFSGLIVSGTITIPEGAKKMYISASIAGNETVEISLEKAD